MTNLIERLHTFHKDQWGEAYLTQLTITVSLFIWTVIIYSIVRVPTPQVVMWINIGVVLAIVYLVSFFLLKLFREATDPIQSHAYWWDKLRKVPKVRFHIITREADIVIRRGAGETIPESDIEIHVDEIWVRARFFIHDHTVRKFIKLIEGVGVIAILLSLIMMNLTYLLGEGFNTLDQNAPWFSYLYNTVSAMFMVGFDILYPTQIWGRIVSVINVLIGISLLVVVLDFITTSVQEESEVIRDALRIHLLATAGR